MQCESSEVGQKCRVLVVEDDAASRNALRLLLKHCGFEGAYAGSVNEAMELLGWGPNCLILDLMLPDGSGGQVLERVRAENLPIRVAIATGASEWKDLVDVPRLAPDVVFRKPLDFSKLVQWLTTCIPPA